MFICVFVNVHCLFLLFDWGSIVSVINQMLKDLDKRTPETGQSTVPPLTSKKTSTFKIVLICAVVLLCLNFVGFYFWSVFEKSQFDGLKQETNQVANIIPKIITQDTHTNNTRNSKTQTTNILTNKNSKIVSQDKDSEKLNEQQFSKTITAEINPVENTVESNQQPEVNKIISISSKKLTQEIFSDNKHETSNKSAKELNLVSTKTVQKTNQQPITKQENLSKMSVSRRQLTPKELITQKFEKAEKFVNLNEIFKAEQLFEEILIIDPTDKQARKKLAALWFGRKSYQQALNLLSQGIVLDKQDSELRLMKARIHIKQGQHLNAYEVLKPLSYLEQEEYQVMLANIAQKVEQYPSAISAYQLLINMQPYSGRWHLGLAIIYDKTSQFSLASNKYKIALTKTDLSASSAKFAKQRLQAIGE